MGENNTIPYNSWYNLSRMSVIPSGDYGDLVALNFIDSFQIILFSTTTALL